MTYEYKQIGEFTREYTVPISQEALDQRIHELTNEVASNAHLKGFRKGRTPRKVISQRYGSAIENDVLEEIVNENCSAILSDEGLQVGWIGRPFLATPADAPYTYKVRIETMPKIEIGDLAELTIKRPNINLTDDEVRKQIYYTRERCIEWYELKGDEIQSKQGDRVWIEVPLNSEGTDDQESENASDVTSERFPIVLRSPMDDVSKSLHEQLVGLKLNHDLNVSREALSNELDIAEEDLPDSPLVTLVRIDIGDLPHLGESLFARPEFRRLVDSTSDAKIESIADLMPVARRSIEQAIERTTEHVLQIRAMWGLATQHVKSIPREVLRQQFFEDTHVGEQNIQTTFMAFQLFDPIVNGESLDQRLLMAQPHVHDHDDVHDHEHESTTEPDAEQAAATNGENELLPESIQVFWKGEVNRAIQKVAFSLSQKALIEQRGIEADKEWVASQIQAKADSVSMVEDQSRVPEYLDYVYGEQHYQELVNQSLLDQATNLLLEEATIEDEHIDFESLFSQSSSKEIEDALSIFKVAPSLPDPEGLAATSGLGSKAETASNAHSESAIGNADESTPVVEEVVQETAHDDDGESRKGIFQRLFRKNS